MSDRLTKQQLKEDPLMKRTGDFLDFARENSRFLIGGVVGVIVIVGIFMMTRNASTRAEDRAAGLLAQANTEYLRGSLDPAAVRLGEILASMGGTDSGKQALLLLADVRYSQGRYPEAEDAYRRAIDALESNELLHTSARRGLAATLENTGNHAAAAAAYLELAKDTHAIPVKKDLLLSAARNYSRGGNVSQAEAIYQELANDPLDTTSAAEEAQLRLAELRARQAG